MNTEELMQFIAKSTNTKIACLNSLGDFYDVLTEELIDRSLCIKPPNEPGYFILSPYTCDGTCEVGSHGYINGERCKVFLPSECSKWCIDLIEDTSCFRITYKMLEELLS